jgi:hypothetical protein
VGRRERVERAGEDREGRAGVPRADLSIGAERGDQAGTDMFR